MTQDDLKRAAARAAMQFVVPGKIVGVGTGSTANFFIDALAQSGIELPGAVASSEATAKRLAAHGIRVLDLNGKEVMEQRGAFPEMEYRFQVETLSRGVYMIEVSDREGRTHLSRFVKQ